MHTTRTLCTKMIAECTVLVFGCMKIAVAQSWTACRASKAGVVQLVWAMALCFVLEHSHTRHHLHNPSSLLAGHVQQQPVLAVFRLHLLLCAPERPLT